MRLAGQIILATTLTISVAAGGAGALLLAMERAQLTAEVEAETRMLASSVEVSVENALRDGQVPDVAELLDRLEQLAGRMDVLVYDAAGGLIVASEGSTPTAEEEGAVLAELGERAHVVRFVESASGTKRVLVAQPLRQDDGRRMGTLVLSRPLDALDADLRSTTLAVVAATVAFAGATALITALVLRQRFTRPVERLAQATERLATDLDAPLQVPARRHDELGDLGRTVLDLQAALRRARDERAAEVERREKLERDLRAADKLIAIGQLASGVAHEIGSPLQVVVGQALLLAESVDDPELVQQASVIAEHVGRITRIVERMQDLVRRRPPRRAPVDLAAEVHKVADLMAPEARQRGIRLAWTRPAPSPDLLADPDEVQQVALNLILNAVQATPPGGTVEVTVEDRGATLALGVRDTGRGIEPERLPHIFDPFQTSRVAEGGTGLGLAVVRSIVDRNGGRVEVSSTVGVGSTFVVLWPKGSDA